MIFCAAYRTLHTTQPAQTDIPTTSTTSAHTPITEIAKLNSNQLSLETPNNKAGACSHFPNSITCGLIDRVCARRVCAVHHG